MVRLEDGGRRLADAALADLLQIERGVLAVLDPGEHEQLSGLLRTLLITLDP
jgi:DNA-binding MarR family transcriptional regulator